MVGDEFIFIENPKTASSSIRTALKPHASPLLAKHNNLFSDTIIPRKRHRICVVRNPWDRMVSGYHHDASPDLGRGDIQDRFEKWLTGEVWITGPGVDFKRTSQKFWTHKCNQVLRFENLGRDAQRAFRTLGIDLFLPHKKKTIVRLPYRC